MTGTAGLADVDVGVLNIADLTDAGLAVEGNVAEFAGGHSDLSQTLVGFLCHQLCNHTCGTDQLCAATDVQLNVVDESTDRDGADGKHVAGLDVSGLAVDEGIADL